MTCQDGLLHMFFMLFLMVLPHPALLRGLDARSCCFTVKLQLLLGRSAVSEFQQGSFRTICLPRQHKENQVLIYGGHHRGSAVDDFIIYCPLNLRCICAYSLPQRRLKRHSNVTLKKCFLKDSFDFIYLLILINNICLNSA